LPLTVCHAVYFDLKDREPLRLFLAIAARLALSERPRTVARDGTLSTYKLF
jgi:hypothetical protein